MDTKLFLSACGAALIAAGEAFNQAAASAGGNDAPPASRRRTTSASATDASDDTPARSASSRSRRAPPSDDGEKEDDDAGIDYEKDVRPAVVALSKDHGRDAALEVLEKFTNPATDEPCTKGQEVDPADYEKLLKAIKRKRAELDD